MRMDFLQDENATCDGVNKLQIIYLLHCIICMDFILLKRTSLFNDDFFFDETHSDRL